MAFRRYSSLQERLLANSVPQPCPVSGLEGDCWIWTGARTNGYGKISMRIGGVHCNLWAHRVSFQTFVGRELVSRKSRARTRPKLHLCSVRACINPAHLRTGTQSQNIRQCVKEGRHYSHARDGVRVRAVPAQGKFVY